MGQYSPKEVASIFVDFLHEEGMFQTFKTWLEGMGYTLDELEIGEE